MRLFVSTKLLRQSLMLTGLFWLLTPFLAHADMHVQLTLDKSSYSQGELVQITAWAEDGDDDILRRVRDAQIEIRDPERHELVEADMRADDHGRFHFDYPLAESAAVGDWRVKVRIESRRDDDSAREYFTVVENSQGDHDDHHDGDHDHDGTGEDPQSIDYDGDGFSPLQGDCDDNDSTIYPGAPEICGDGIDQDCSGADLPCTPPPPADEHYGSDCVGCHGTEATEVHGSLHYQWQGPGLDMVNQPGTQQGKLTNAVNSYCINIMGNWAGCSACHVGKGALPEAVASPEQLANIDCLKCHSQGGVLPTRVDCLTCHAKAGGGDAVKRGDLALASGTTGDRNYDIHMATSGANLQCQSCHITQSHRIAGKGSDLRATDLDIKVECSNCHNSAPHDNSTLNQHTARVACQSCHIPIYAKNAADTDATEATEIFRTWRATEATTAPMHPAATKANDLLPRYRFWNGQSDNYLLGDVAQLDPATGRYPTSRPVGSVQEGKLYPFKYKTAEQPMTSGSNLLIALDTSVFFVAADADAATRQGLLNMGMSDSTPWEWVETDTFQALNHQVSPQEQALSCSSCHGSTDRMDLQGQLGYQLKGSQSVVCTQCHGREESRSFESIHDKHVRDKGYDCSRCHTFSRPERGLRM